MALPNDRHMPDRSEVGMRAVQAMRFGGPEVLVVNQVPKPVVGPGQALVDVSVADVLFLDTMIRRGAMREYFSVQPPYIPGGGVAGEVISVGEGVDEGWVGRRVVARTGQSGGYAEQVVVPADGLILVPDELSLREAAALLHDAPTALGLVEQAAIQPDDWVLVTAAGGGLGILLVQLARAQGARVIGAARGKQKLDLVREMGADLVVDYSEPSWLAWVRAATGGAGADVIFDGVGGSIGSAAFEVTARGGRFSAHGAPSGAFARIDPQEAQQREITMRGIEQVQFVPTVAKRLIEQALSKAVAGRIRPVIGQTFPLEQAAKAHTAVEARSVIGKTLLLIK